MKFKSFDVGFPDLANPTDYVKLAQTSEKYGFDCVWLQEGASWEPLSISAVILNRTRSINVGTGVVSIFKRHPEILSTETATLSELSEGRFILGIGPGSRMSERFAINFPPLTGTREATEILRRLLSGNSFTYNGKVFHYNEPRPLKIVPKRRVPIYFGAMKPKMIRMACDLGDGLLISRRGGSSPQYVKQVLDLVKSTREEKKTSKPGDVPFSVRSFLESAIDDVRDRALKTMREVFAAYTLPLMPREVLEKTECDWNEIQSIVDRLRQGETDIATLISEELIGKLSMTGTPRDCIDKLQQFQGTGLETPILYLHGPDPERALKLAGEEILPQFS